jgi:hypothetical protein
METKKSPFIQDFIVILLGVLLIMFFVPLLQWLDRMSVGNNFEMDIPVPGAVGMLLFFVIINAVVYMLSHKRLLSTRHILILYVMLTVSIPFSNVGLMQGFFSSLTGISSEYLDRKIPTITEGYKFQNPLYCPKLSDEDYKLYMKLTDDIKCERGDPVENKAKQSELLLSFKRFWSGVGIDDNEKKRFENPSWTFFHRTAASFMSIPWKIWRMPLVMWTIFFMLVLVMTMFLARIFTKTWTERENLAFPVAQVPYSVLAGDPQSTPLFKNGFFWAGFGLSALLLLFSGLCYYKILPAVPQVGINFQRIDFRYIFSVPPWNLISFNILYFSPCMVGLALMVNKEILRGIVVFFVGSQLVRMVAGMFNNQIAGALGIYWPGYFQVPYYSEMAVGAGVVFAITLLWRSRDMLSWKTDKRSLLGLCITIFLIICWWYGFGISGLRGLLAIMIILLWTLVSIIVIARGRAEAGAPLTTTSMLNPQVGIQTGGIMYGLPNLITLSHSFMLTISALPGLLAAQMEGIYIAKKTGTSSTRAITTSVFIAFFTAIVTGLVSYLVMSYWLGSQNFSQRFQDNAKMPIWMLFVGGDVNWDRFQTEYIRLFMVVTGAAVMIMLLVLRKKLPKFSLPPIAFIITCMGIVYFQKADFIGNSDYYYLTVNFVWGPVLIAWILKSLVLRFGGMDLYIKTSPVALGLITGHCVMIFVWNVYHAVFSPPNMMVFLTLFQ